MTSGSEEDCRLIRRAAEGDPRAYAALFERHADRIRRVAYLLLHNTVAAEDAVQEAFTRRLARLESFRGESRPDVWLYGIGLNVCREYLRQERTREQSAHPRTLEGGRLPGRTVRGVVTSAMRREAARDLAIALGHLTDGQREVFVLHYIEGLPYSQISDLLGLSPVAARSMAHRAKSVLREKLPRHISLPRAT